MHTAKNEMQCCDEEKQSLVQKLAQMEWKFDKLEEEADAMRNRAFTAEGRVQLVEAKLQSAVFQDECQLEEAHNRNQFLERKVGEMETHRADKEIEYKEKKQQLKAELFQWKQKAESVKDELEQTVPSYKKRIEELQGKLTVAHNESGKLRLALTHAERAREDLATTSRKTENEVTRLRSLLQENDAKAQSERDERDRNLQVLEGVQRRLLEAEGRLNVSNQLNDFYKSKLVALEEEKAMRVPIVAQNAVLKKKLHDKEKHLDDATAQCAVQVEKIGSLENDINTMKGLHNQTIEALEAKVYTLATEEIILREEVDHFRIRLASAEKENQILKNTLSALKSQLSAALEEKDKLQRDLNLLKKTKNSEDVAAKEQIKELDTQLKELRSKGDYLEFQLAEREADTNGQLSVLDSQLESTLFQVASLENDISYLNEQKLLYEAHYADQVRNLENQLKQSATELALLKDEALIAAALQSCLDERTNDLDEAKSQVTNQVRSNRELTNTIIDLKSQLFESEIMIDALRAKLSRAQCKDENKVRKASLKAIARDYEKEVTNLRERIAMLEEDKLRNMEHVRLLESNFM